MKATWPTATWCMNLRAMGPRHTGGAFSDKMQAVGDVGDPVIGKLASILAYQRDVPPN